MKKIKFFDSTLRDGSHAVNHQFNADDISLYCAAMDDAGMNTVIVGHGNGLGASSVQMGMCAMDELDMLRVAKRNLNHTKLGTFITVGFGTIEEHIKPAIHIGANLFCIATHCTEANITRKHIEYLSNMGKEVYGVLMNIHLASSDELLEQAKKIQAYGADGVILMDSAGASLPETVKEKIGTLYDNLNIEIGFHPHNNLGLAIANAYIAIQNGATIIDGTICGFGAGAGNCQLEALKALLIQEKIASDAKFYSMLNVANDIVNKRFKYEKGIDSTCIVSGYAGVVSTFKHRVEYIANQYDLDARDIFIELGRRRAIAGQDDLILEVAQWLSKNK